MKYRLAFYLGLFLLAGPSSAWACSLDPTLPEPTPEERFEKAAIVVAAHMLKVEEVEAPNEIGQDMLWVEGTFRPIELLKGELPAGNKVSGPAYGPGNCSLPLLAGSDYIFYLDGEKNFVIWPSGSEMFFSLDTPDGKKVLDDLRVLANKQ